MKNQRKTNQTATMQTQFFLLKNNNKTLTNSKALKTRNGKVPSCLKRCCRIVNMQLVIKKSNMISKFNFVSNIKQ